MPSDVALNYYSQKPPHIKEDFPFEASHFSDTIVLSCRPGRPTLQIFALRVQSICAMLLDGHYTRGAIVVGKVHHEISTVFGPALIEAYELEKNVAKYPRVIVTPDAFPHISPTIPTRTDHDGLVFVDMLGIIADNAAKKDFSAKVLSQTKERLKKDSNDLGRVAKHQWMIRYIESVI
jgi:hypothetical protein